MSVTRWVDERWPDWLHPVLGGIVLGLMVVFVCVILPLGLTGNLGQDVTRIRHGCVEIVHERFLYPDSVERSCR